MSKFLPKKYLLRAIITPYEPDQIIPHGGRVVTLAKDRKYLIQQEHRRFPDNMSREDLEKILDRAAYNFPGSSVDFRVSEDKKLTLIIRGDLQPPQ